MGYGNAHKRILQATEQILRNEGYGRLTTKLIAETAGVAEGSIYYHFADKAELIASIVELHLPRLLEITRPLAARAGTSTVRHVLGDAAHGLVAFYSDLQPIIGTLQADPAMLHRMRHKLADAGRGPHRGVEAVAAYLQAERAQGRVRGDADLPTSAAVFVGACHHSAFQAWLSGTDPEPAPRLIAEHVALTLCPDQRREPAASVPDRDPGTNE